MNLNSAISFLLFCKAVISCSHETIKKVNTIWSCLLFFISGQFPKQTALSVADPANFHRWCKTFWQKDMPFFSNVSDAGLQLWCALLHWNCFSIFDIHKTLAFSMKMTCQFFPHISTKASNRITNCKWEEQWINTLWQKSFGTSQLFRDLEQTWCSKMIWQDNLDTW